MGWSQTAEGTSALERRSQSLSLISLWQIITNPPFFALKGIANSKFRQTTSHNLMEGPGESYHISEKDDPATLGWKVLYHLQ
jgi:hypothetical protein